jgi:hypothetical protein
MVEAIDDAIEEGYKARRRKLKEEKMKEKTKTEIPRKKPQLPRRG